MAEDSDKKPKVTLIKQSKRPEAPETQERPPVADHDLGEEHGEKRKIVVVKKKKPQVRVVAKHEGDGEGEERHAETPPVEAKAPHPPVSHGEAEPQAAASQAAARPHVEVQPQREAAPRPEGTEAPRPPVDRKPAEANPYRGVREMPKTERPNVVAGQVGPRRDDRRPMGSGGSYGRSPDGGFSPNNRPASRQGVVGGRPVGGGSGGGGGYDRRPPAPGQRPMGGGPGRPMGGGPGGRPGYGPRPMGNRPPRPGMGGPRMGGGSGGGAPATENKKPVAKKFIKAKRPSYQKKETELTEKALQLKKKQVQKANPIPKEIDIMESISVAELARKMNLKASDLIAKLMSMGMMVTINQQIDSDTASILASEYGCNVNVVSLYDETVIETEKDNPETLRHRPPIVTVMGHVDHGKTKLLDAIRKTDVVAGEFGGITQHIGAYMVETGKGKITFLDTPGHEAFTMMRARGAQITDIVILVVAANDGVMPQTLEALDHAREAKVPIIVAINKVDLPEANPDRVKTQLAERGLNPEDWGGDTIYNEVSALQKKGIQELLDSILVQAEILELNSNFDCRAEGKVLESKIDHGRGIVASIIVERGTLKVGDSFVAGIYPGKVRAIFNDRGEKVEEATPAMPVEIIGLEGMPNAGDPFQATENEKFARQISMKRQELKRFEESKSIKKITLDNLYDTINQGTVQELKVIIKADVQGSAEAIKASLEKLSTKEVRLNVIHSSAGPIIDGDVTLASASNALLIAFNVRPTPKAKALADQEKVDIRKYNIIYRVVDDVRAAMEGMLAPEYKEQDLGVAEVREVFKVPKIGIVAGCFISEGKVRRNCAVHVIREGIELFSGKINSLKRFKDDVREVETGYECGIGIEGLQDLQVGDQLEVFETIEISRKLDDSRA